MIDTEQTITIDAPIDKVWAYAHDINGWAKLMPGLQECAVIDDDDSRWTLKVGVGALVRTVKVFVHVGRWAGPAEVDFTYNLEGDPVNGGGAYRARALGPGQTEVTLSVHVNGEGPMAPMWEAMGKPLLPKFARAFAEQFKAEIEQGMEHPDTSAHPLPHEDPAASRPTAEPQTVLARLFGWLRRLFAADATTTTK